MGQRAEQATGGPRTVQDERTVIDVLPVRDVRTGEVVYASPDDVDRGGPVAGPAPALWKDETGDVRVIRTEREDASRLPAERMAGDGWGDVVATIQALEDGGGTPGDDVVVRPGGRLEVARPDGSTQVSTLPAERMAAGPNPGPCGADVAELRRLDPDNREGWQPVASGTANGWTFRFPSPVPGQDEYVFLAFRSPADGNRWRVTPLQPNLDGRMGHDPHLIDVRIGGRTLTVICGPRGRACPDLRTVRGDAAKWMAFHAAHSAGFDPGFGR